MIYYIRFFVCFIYFWVFCCLLVVLNWVEVFRMFEESEVVSFVELCFVFFKMVKLKNLKYIEMVEDVIKFYNEKGGLFW